MKELDLCVAVMGATGAVGQQMLRVLEERAFPIGKIRLLASARSEGKKIPFRGRLVPVEVLTEQSFEGVDLVLASAGGSISQKFAPIAAAAGAVVVDNTSAFRMDPNVPLVVPEANAHALKNHKGIIANPNCSTAQMIVVLKPIQDKVGIRRLVISTYQSVSGTGQKAIDEVLRQSRAILDGETNFEKKVYPHQIAFNVLPHIDVFLDNGYTKEEMKMVNETRKILEDNSIQITATTARVPVLRGHSESINIETRKKITVDEVRELMKTAPGVVLVDNPAENDYPTPAYCKDCNDTYVGRIRKDISNENGIDLWCVSDNLRKGAAWNAVQIAEELIKQRLLNRMR
ncbi:MAG: aspartate-semialdehyde dehydrogenase [Candidatus Sumerlaeales bacterium]|nr:aspartate-semialdehyde dehydrogenase [Candidatus Sumerlaeales bacterium]